MKNKISFFLLLFCFCTTFGYAQRLGGNHNEDVEPTNAGFGVKGGINLSNVYQTQDIKVDNFVGWHAGLYTKFSLSDKFALQLEALYSRKGLKFSLNGIDNERRMDYIEVPLLLYYSILDNVSLHLGPQASLLITLKDQDNRELALDGYHTFDMGAAGGVEAKLSIFRLGARYTLGFLDVVNESEARNIQNFTLEGKNFRQGVLQGYVAVAIK